MSSPFRSCTRECEQELQHPRHRGAHPVEGLIEKTRPALPTWAKLCELCVWFSSSFCVHKGLCAGVRVRARHQHALRLSPFLAGAGDPERVKGMRDTSGERGWNRRENYRFRARSSPNGEERTIRAEPPHGHVLSSYPERASDLTPLVAQATNWRRNVKSIHLTVLHKQANKQTNRPMSMSRSDRRTCNE